MFYDEAILSALNNSKEAFDDSIRIIIGIDKEHPYWYRVAVGQQGFVHSNVKRPQLMAMAARCHTMEPNNDNNLKMFKKELQCAKSFSLCPAYMPDFNEQPRIYEKLMIRKKCESIIICNACDLQNDDLLSFSAILPTDNPIIPSGKENAPILEMIERKKKFR